MGSLVTHLASGGSVSDAIPECPTHNSLHANEETAVIGQRVLAELVCEQLLRVGDPLATEVLAALQAYRMWCESEWLTESEEIDAGNGRTTLRAVAAPGTWSMWENRSISVACRLYDAERARIDAAKPVLDDVWNTLSADSDSELVGDLARVDAAIARWAAGRGGADQHAAQVGNA